MPRAQRRCGRCRRTIRTSRTRSRICLPGPRDEHHPTAADAPAGKEMRRRSDRMSPLGNALLAAVPMLAAIFAWGVVLALIGG